MWNPLANVNIPDPNSGGFDKNFTIGGTPFDNMFHGAGGSVKTINPVLPTIQNPVNQNQLDQSAAGVGGSLTAQQNLLNALQNQNALGAQRVGLQGASLLQNQLQANNGAFNQQNTYGSQEQLLNALRGSGGVNAQQNALMQQGYLSNNLQQLNGAQTQQQALAGLQNIAAQQNQTNQMYQNVAQGRGPNPAQAALNQATGQNVANQAALMAGQRGAGANVGLLARQAAQQGAGIQQNAVGQGATMQAQQQLNALSGLTAQQQAQAATQGQIGAMGQNIIGQQQGAIGQLAGQGANLTAQQQAAINAAAGVAQNQVGNQLAANQAYNAQGNVMAGQALNQANTYNAAQQAQQNAILGAQANYNQAQVGGQGSVNAANAATNASKVQAQSGILGGVLGAAGAIGAGALMGGGGASAGPAAAAVLAAKGGTVEKPQEMAGGGLPIMDPQTEQQQGLLPPIAPDAIAPGSPYQPMDLSKPASDFGRYLASRSSSTGTPSGGDLYSSPNMSPSEGLYASQGGKVHDLKGGGDVKAKNQSEKAKYQGDNYKNDAVKAMLSEGEIVLPRSVVQSKDPIKASAEFVRNELAKRGRK